MPPAARCRYWPCMVCMACALHCRAGVHARRTDEFLKFFNVRRGQGPALQTGGNGQCARKPRAGRTPAGPHICGPYKPPGNAGQWATRVSAIHRHVRSRFAWRVPCIVAGVHARRTDEFLKFFNVRRGQGPALQTGGNGQCARKPRAGRTPAGPHICGPYKPPGNAGQMRKAGVCRRLCHKNILVTAKLPCKPNRRGPKRGPGFLHEEKTNKNQVSSRSTSARPPASHWKSAAAQPRSSRRGRAGSSRRQQRRGARQCASPRAENTSSCASL